MTYRSEIDGLRAFAVLPVIFFHAGIPTFQGGFVGVDVFFVISGYLITSLILRDLATGTFSFKKFYERRARRILPALFAVILASLPFAWALMMPAEMKAFSSSLISVLLFSSNIHFWSLNDYFDTSSELKPLLHTWSLSIEEQFYILFPILLIFLWHRGKKYIREIIVLIALASILFSQYASYYHPPFNFYWLPSRAWELLAGALCAFVNVKPYPLRDNSLSAVGLAAIIMSVFYYDETIAFPSFYALLPVLGTCAVLTYARRGTYAWAILSFKPFVAIGLVSYSAYLWHQPVFALTRLRSPDLTAGEIAALVFLVFVLAAMTWWLVEQPFRHPTRGILKSRLNLVKIFGLSAFVLLGFAFLGKFYDGPALRLTEDELKLVSTANRSPKRSLCHTAADDPLTPAETSCIYFGSKPSTAVLGNSHGVELAYGLASILREQNQSLIHFTISACQPNFGRSTVEYCDRFFQSRLEYILSHPEIENVVLAFRSDLSGAEGAKSLIDLANFLQRARKNVVLVLQAPPLKFDVFYYLREVIRAGRNAASSLTRQEWLEKNRALYIELDRIDPAVHVLDLATMFCDNQNCFAVRNGMAMYYDSHHMSLSAANIVAGHLFPALKFGSN